MNIAAWRLRAAAAVALAAVAILLTVPEPKAQDVVAAAGPLTLATVWPDARTVDLAAVLPDGGAFYPWQVLDARTVIGTVTSADYVNTSLVVLSVADPEHPRVLQAASNADTATVNALATAGGQVYWMTGTMDEQGKQHTSLFRADLAGGQPRLLTTDTGEASYSASQYDLQVIDGRLYWIATRTVRPLTSELRSISVDGGPVTVAPLDGPYALTAWPWLMSFAVSADQTTITQLNASTGEHRTISPRPGEQLSCSPIWCRGILTGANGSVISLRHADGSGETRVNVDGEGSVTNDVAAMDRFELVAAPISNQQATQSEKLTMYDLKTHRRVALAVATAEGVRGSWLWWSSGDNETRTWHLLDLSALA